MSRIKIKNPVLGAMFLDLNEENRIKLLDSNKSYVGYVYTDELEKDVQYYVEKLTEIKDVCEIVELGFCNNMIFGKSINDLVEEYMDYCDDCDYSDLSNKFEEAKETIEAYINVIGNDYFLVDFDEL